MLQHWLRGLRLLRYPELVAWLGRQEIQLCQIRRLEATAEAIRIADSVQLIGWSPQLLELSARVTIGCGSILAFGDELNGYGRIVIGPDTWIGEYNNIRSGGGSIEIGRCCMISQFVSIIGSGHGLARGATIVSQHPPADKRGVRIGNDVWIGAGATILPGVHIADGAVVAAGAVVSRSIESYAIVAGVPAVVIGTRK